MKQILLFTAILILSIFSSCKDDYEEANEDIKGSWILSSMEYKDSTGTIKVINDSDITLTFLDDKESTSDNDSGFQIVDGDTMSFSYYASPSTCQFLFAKNYDLVVGHYETWPIDAIGRMTVYNFAMIDKKTIEFSVDYEFEYLTNQKLTNVSYLYTKVK